MMKWYEIVFYIISAIGFVVGVFTWFGIEPIDIRYLIERFGGLFNVQVIGITLIVIGVIGSSMAIFVEIKAGEKLYVVLLTKLLPVLIGCGGIGYAMVVAGRT